MITCKPKLQIHAQAVIFCRNNQIMQKLSITALYCFISLITSAQHLLIKNITVINTKTGQALKNQDVLIESGKIQSITNLMNY